MVGGTLDGKRLSSGVLRQAMAIPAEAEIQATKLAPASGGVAVAPR